MKRLKDDEIRFRRALAASGKRIEDVDPLELAKKAKVNPRRAAHFARTMRGPALPAEKKPTKKPEVKPDVDVQG